MAIRCQKLVYELWSTPCKKERRWQQPITVLQIEHGRIKRKRRVDQYESYDSLRSDITDMNSLTQLGTVLVTFLSNLFWCFEADWRILKNIPAFGSCAFQPFLARLHKDDSLPQFAWSVCTWRQHSLTSNLASGCGHSLVLCWRYGCLRWGPLLNYLRRVAVADSRFQTLSNRGRFCCNDGGFGRDCSVWSSVFSVKLTSASVGGRIYTLWLFAPVSRCEQPQTLFFVQLHRWKLSIQPKANIQHYYNGDVKTTRFEDGFQVANGATKTTSLATRPPSATMQWQCIS